MKEYFIVSDCHSFYTPLITSLNSSGFDINNEEHIIIFNGDIFDRGTETITLYNFIMSIPKERRIMIRGNHEELYLDLLNKEYPESHDFSNGTVRTFCAIAGAAELSKYDRYFLSDCVAENAWAKIVKKVKDHEITNWLQSDEWLNYYELDKYIITHSFIPLKIKDTIEARWCKNRPVYYVEPALLEPVENWRTNATALEWNDARWGCPYEYFDTGLFYKEIKNKKVLVCGHWHTSDFHDNYEIDVLNKDGTVKISQKDNYTIYYGKNLIAIDACTAYTNMTNVLHIKDSKCYDKNGKKLSVKRSLKKSR